MFSRSARRRPATLMLLLAGWLAPGFARAIEPDTMRDQDPALGAPEAGEPVAKFHPRLKALWLEALARPEADLKRQAADAIARAHPLGMPGLKETAPLLVAEMEAADARPVVRQSMARALVALEAKETAPDLMRYAQSGGPEAARMVEPALARWDHAPMRPVWLARLTDPKTRRAALLLAVRAAGVLKMAEAVPHLRRLAIDVRGPGDVRLEAARSLAVASPAGLEAEARALAADTTPARLTDRLVAGALLQQHRSADAKEILLRLAADPEPAVAGNAVGRLLELDPASLKGLFDGLVKSPDSTLRRLAARGLAELKTVEAVDRLAPLLADPHLETRVFAREALIRLDGTESLRATVRQGTMRALAGSDPRGLEQAAMVVGAIRHDPAADRLVRLLPHPSAEIRVATAWALRRLAVPRTAGPILERVKLITSGATAKKPDEPRDPVPFRDLEHLIEALGVLKHAPAEAVLRKYIPPPPIPPPSGEVSPLWLSHLRAAAVWSLGQIHPTGDIPSDLVAVLRERLRNADTDSVRAAVAVSLGRLMSGESASVLRECHAAEKEDVLVRRAAGWAVGQITGEALPPPAFPVSRREKWHTGWFLEPVEPATPKGN